MTSKRFRKLMRAHFTAYYLQNKDTMGGWISGAYRAADKVTASNYDKAYEAIVSALIVY